MATPLIGITTSRLQHHLGFPMIAAAEAYVAAVSNAGACPVLVPLGLPDDRLRSLLNRLDGILFTGGGDIAPERYGGEPHPRVDGVDPDRDRVEIQLFQENLATGRPFLGICRGLQVINVALGGSLYEDILDQREGSLQHQYYPDWPRSYLAHPVNIAANSRLAAVLGITSVEVNSLHHQSIRRMAPGLQATAEAPDGVIEAVELPEHPFGLAVQWHPEWLQEHPAMRGLFAAFVQAADARQSAAQRSRE